MKVREPTWFSGFCAIPVLDFWLSRVKRSWLPAGTRFDTIIEKHALTKVREPTWFSGFCVIQGSGFNLNEVSTIPPDFELPRQMYMLLPTDSSYSDPFTPSGPSTYY